MTTRNKLLIGTIDGSYLDGFSKSATQSVKNNQNSDKRNIKKQISKRYLIPLVIDALNKNGVLEKNQVHIEESSVLLDSEEQHVSAHIGPNPVWEKKDEYVPLKMHLEDRGLFRDEKNLEDITDSFIVNELVRHMEAMVELYHSLEKACVLNPETFKPVYGIKKQWDVYAIGDIVLETSDGGKWSGELRRMMTVVDGKCPYKQGEKPIENYIFIKARCKSLQPQYITIMG